MESELQRLLDVYYGNSSDARLKKVVETKLNEWKRRPDGPKIAFDILCKRQGNAYLQFFCLTILEDLVSKRWNKVESQYASKIRQLLFTFLTANDKHCPRYVRTKAAKVYVSVGVQDWPERYAGFWNHIEHTATQASTRTVGTHVLAIALETFGNVDKTGTTLNLLSSRRKKIKHMMKAQIPGIMRLLTVLLQRSVGKDDEMTILSLRALLSLLTYNNIRDLPELPLLNELFKTMQCYKNEIGVVSMQCFVEIMNNVVIPPDKLSYLLSVAKHILGLLNTFASQPKLRNEAEENYVPQLLSFVSIFIQKHMSRIYCNDTFPMKQTLELIHKFTFLQSDSASNFLACLEIWVVTATFVSEMTEQRSHELNTKQRQRLLCFEPIFSQLMNHLWPRALMSTGGETILSLDDEEPVPTSSSSSSSSQSSSELVNFQHKITNSIAMMLFSSGVTNAFASLLVPTARTSLQILGITSNTDQQRENQRRAAIDLAVVFESITTSSQRFSHSQVVQTKVVEEILRLAITTAGMSAKQCLHSRNSAYRRLHTSALLAAQGLLKWCGGIRTANAQIKEFAENAANVALNSIVTSISMPPESVIKAGVSLLRCVVLELEFLSTHPTQWKALQPLQLHSEHGTALAQFVSRLPRFAQGGTYAMFARASMKGSKQTCTQWLESMMRPVLGELSSCANSDAVGSQLEMASSRIERACMICTDVIREFRDSAKDKRRACLDAMRGMIDSSSKLLVLFLEAVSRNSVSRTEHLSGRARVRAKRVETLLLRTSKHLFALHGAVFQSLGHVVDMQYVGSAVRTILSTMNEHVLRRLLPPSSSSVSPTKNSRGNGNSVMLLEHCIEILTCVADDRTRHFQPMIPEICKFLIGMLYPCLCNVWACENMPVDLTKSYFKCLRAMLLNRHGDFVISKSMSRAKGVKRNFTSPDSAIFWRRAFESMARYLDVKNAPPNILQYVLELLHELDEKHGSFECFNPAMLTAFGSLLLRMISSRSHELLEDVLMKTTFAVAKTNMNLFSDKTMIEFLRSVGAANRVKPDFVLNLQTRVRNYKGSSHEFKGTLASVMNDLAFIF